MEEDKFKEKAIIEANIDKLRPLLYEKDILMFKLECLINKEVKRYQEIIRLSIAQGISEKYNTTETGY